MFHSEGVLRGPGEGKLIGAHAIGFGRISRTLGEIANLHQRVRYYRASLINYNTRQTATGSCLTTGEAHQQHNNQAADCPVFQPQTHRTTPQRFESPKWGCDMIRPSVAKLTGAD